MKVKIYMEFVNAWGNVTGRTLIAQFRNIEWAKVFIEEAKKSEDETTRIVVEEKD